MSLRLARLARILQNDLTVFVTFVLVERLKFIIVKIVLAPAVTALPKKVTFRKITIF